MIDIDEVLRTRSRQWNDDLPGPADLDEHLNRLYAQPTLDRGRRWIVPLLAAAAVASLAIGLAVTAGIRHTQTTASGVTSATTAPTTTRAASSAHLPGVPAVVGLSGFNATNRLLHDGFRKLRFVAQVSPLRVGKVLAQTPRAGAVVADKSQSIRLTISAGPNPREPFVVVPRIGTCMFSRPNARRLCAGGPITAKVIAGPGGASPSVAISSGLASPDTTSRGTAHGCSGVDGPVVSLTVYPDVIVPNLGCVILKRTQRLRVVNATDSSGQRGETITLRLRGLPSLVVPNGQARIYSVRPGNLLAPGQHFGTCSNSTRPGTHFVLWIR